MKVAINKCYGGFGLSPEATLKLYERGVPDIATPVAGYFGSETEETSELQKWRSYQPGKDRGLFITVFSPDEKHVLYAGRATNLRSHPELIRVIEEMGTAANGACADIKIIEIPDGIEFDVEEYDGLEHIAERHSTWG